MRSASCRFTSKNPEDNVIIYMKNLIEKRFDKQGALRKFAFYIPINTD